MPVTAYLVLVDYDDKLLTSGSTTPVTSNYPLPGRPAVKPPGAYFAIEDFTLDVEQTLNIGGASTGAGKATLKPLMVNRRVDSASPRLFQMCCTGAHFKYMDLLVVKAGTTGSGSVVTAFGFHLVAIRTISWRQGEEGVDETVTFEYGGVVVGYPKPDQQAFDTTGWNKVTNLAITDPAMVIPDA